MSVLAAERGGVPEIRSNRLSIKKPAKACRFFLQCLLLNLKPLPRLQYFGLFNTVLFANSTDGGVVTLRDFT